MVAKVTLTHSRDIALARRAVSRAFDEMGGKAIRKTRFVTAVSEIARNALTHGGGGEMFVFVHDDPRSVSIICNDQGPGIDDLDRAMTDGYSTTNGMGKGMGGARRLAETFEVKSSAETGTSIVMSARV